MADQPTELLLFSINDLNRVQAEFLEAYNKLMDVACQRLEYALMIKLECMSQCQQIQASLNETNKKLAVTEKFGL
eukprot:CAMPEP_0170485200 /NCGR_PEP_ID=MMETSP0208-20121228/4515_1 /TAXON_ID=197538 /ORGANISM="Strombidium inclinatum, Strain S3" /LENGTH=74 /DNA_ID=CAMNT_0010758773 /DNA_START=364 /DNA_END=588 /DNA_ORIENTATION=+